MLVLSRKSNEQVLFPELGISVEVIRIKGSQVRLGINAPESIRILRGELKHTDGDPKTGPLLNKFCTARTAV